MAKIAIIQAHPDAAAAHYLCALADAYRQGAIDGGHEVRTIQVAQLDFPLLRSAADWNTGELPTALRDAQQAIAWADHLVLFYPLWLGGMPALLKAFLEQVLRPGFAFQFENSGRWKKLLSGKSARIVVTMGMPAFWYRWYFGAHSLKSLKRSILGFCGVAPIYTTLIGMVEANTPKRRSAQLESLRKLGGKAR